MLGNDPKELHWRSLQAVDVITKFETDERGLDSHQVRTRRQKYGHNIIPNIEQRSTVQILLLQFKNLPIILLVTASILSYFLGRGRSHRDSGCCFYDGWFWILYGKEC
jgi:Ca2+-transporting ATPase